MIWIFIHISRRCKRYEITTLIRSYRIIEMERFNSTKNTTKKHRRNEGLVCKEVNTEKRTCLRSSRGKFDIARKLVASFPMRRPSPSVIPLSSTNVKLKRVISKLQNSWKSNRSNLNYGFISTCTYFKQEWRWDRERREQTRISRTKPFLINLLVSFGAVIDRRSIKLHSSQKPKLFLLFFWKSSSFFFC